MRPGASIRVLLVEDDEDDYLLTLDLLREVDSQRYHLDWARTFEEGARAIAAGGYDVHLVDYRLGARHGLELIGEALSAGCGAPLILLTGQEDPELDRQAMAAGAADYLAKAELSPKLLERSIRYAIERARTTEALRRSESNFRSLIERAPDAIAVEREGRFVYANPQMISLLGETSVDALVGRRVVDFVHPDDWNCGENEPGQSREVRLTRSDEAITVDVAGLAARFDGQDAVVIFARDVSEKKRMQERLVLADRLASVGTLAAGVAHEINNPLASVIANLGCIAGALDEAEQRAESGDLSPEAAAAVLRSVREIVQEAEEGADRVRRIVTDLKAVARREPGLAGGSDLRDVLEAALSVSRNEIRRRARLVRQLDPVPEVPGNASQLGQVFVNLLVNAAQAIPEGSAEANEVALLSRTGADGSAVVEVRDSGAGIPEEDLGRLFDPFFTTKPVGTGTGLGLSICDGIVSSLGGRIEVESRVGEGTTVRVILPALQQEPSRHG